MRKMATINIANCTEFAVKNGIISLCGSSNFQGSLSDCQVIVLSAPTRNVLMRYNGFQVETVLPDGGIEEAARNLPQYFYHYSENGVTTCINLRLTSFINYQPSQLGSPQLLFGMSGLPVTLTISEPNPQRVFAQLAERLELLRI